MLLKRAFNPRIFDLEITSACNIDCDFCPRQDIAIGSMRPETLDSFLGCTEFGKRDSISFVGLGEPFCNRRLAEYVETIRNRAPATKTWITTNGTLLEGEGLTRLLEAAVDVIEVSFNGLDREEYERRMVGANYDDVLHNVSRAARLIKEGRYRTTLQITYAGDTTRRKLAKLWHPLGVRHLRINQLRNRAGFVPAPHDLPQNDLSDFYCPVFDLFHYISYSGEVPLCCNDLEHTCVLGNINEDSWETIQARKDAILKENHWPEVCRHCDAADSAWMFQLEMLKSLMLVPLEKFFFR